MQKKPDALLILALIFGLGLAVSAITHGEGDAQAPQHAQKSVHLSP